MRKLWLCILAVALTAQAVVAGETIRVVMSNHPWVTGMVEMLPEFEKETGIKVEVERLGDDQLTQKLTVEFTTGNSSIDVFGVRPPNEGKMFLKNGYFENLDPYFKDDAEYDFADFTPGSVSATRYGDFQTAIPFSIEYEVVFYRKDLLAAKGLNPPDTFEELEKWAELLTDRDNEVYGFVSRGQANALISQFAGFVYGFGSDWYDKETGKSLVNTPEFVAAIGYYGNLLRKYGPPGALNMGWAQAMAVFLQGKAAMYTDGSGTFPNLLNPKTSGVADKTGIALFPAGPAGRKTYDVVPLAIAMYSGSKKKDASWTFIKWMTDKERTAIQQGKYANPCPRMSVYKIPEANVNFPADLVQVFQDSVPYTIPYNLPQVTAVVEARDVIGEAVVAAIDGRDYKAAAEVAHRKFQAILDREADERNAE